jgi:hypothetical protein
MTTTQTEEIDVTKLTSADVADLAARLEEDDYDNAFEGLRDWHLLRSLLFHRADLIEPYYHLLDIETYDEC